MALSFVLSASVSWDVVMHGARFDDTIYHWMQVGGLKMEIGFMVDGLTAMMMCVVTFVSLMVHLYTIGYMQDDDGYNRFFAYISLFTFSMLMLVMSNNLLQLFFGWEAVGLVSYLLIGFWFNKPSAIFANMKAFLVNRVGDFGFGLGITRMNRALKHPIVTPLIIVSGPEAPRCIFTSLAVHRFDDDKMALHFLGGYRG